MHLENLITGSARLLRTAVAGIIVSQMALGLPLATAAQPNDKKDPSKQAATVTPITHVIVIIGENRSFDHVFATYQPKPGQTVSNLLSKGIINADGTRGPNFSLGQQFRANVPGSYSVSPSGKVLFKGVPPIDTGFTATVPSDSHPAPFATVKAALAAEPALPLGYIKFLTTGASGLPFGVVDTRLANVNRLPNGPFQLTPSIAYDDYAASPVHRFYQMWEQSDCNVTNATSANPSGCLNDLYPWVEVTVGAGANGQPQPPGFNEQSTFEGGTSMEFYNVQQGDAPYLTSLANNYTLSDNFHQSIMGGTGANHVALGTGDAIWYSDGHGNSATPPSNQIENPNAQPGTNNFYVQDGYGGGTYTNCSDLSQPGASAVIGYLNTLPYRPNPNCEASHYYLLNNYAPGYFGDGTVNPGTFVIPPSSLRTIGDELLQQGISWKYYGGGYNLYLKDPTYTNPLNAYCDICNPFQYSTSIMTQSKVRTQHINDYNGLAVDIANNTLPAVSYVKPDGFVDGHPTSSKLDLFEGFVQKVVTEVQANPNLAGNTAIFVTFDESGGYWDSGYIQPLDYFGDGPRIPLIIVSPFSTGGIVNHSYADHVSILKFIERNWSLSPITSRSRDNFPNPAVNVSNPYVPTNSPALDDLFDAFTFPVK